MYYSAHAKSRMKTTLFVCKQCRIFIYFALTKCNLCTVRINHWKKDTFKILTAPIALRTIWLLLCLRRVKAFKNIVKQILRAAAEYSS